MATSKTKKLYRSMEVANIFKLKPERLRKWIEIYFGFPFIKAEGTGTTHLFERHHLYIIGLFMILVDSGLNRQEMSNLVMSIDRKRWQQIRQKKKDCYIFIAPDPSKGYGATAETRSRIRDMGMTLNFISGAVLDLSKLSQYMEFSPIWIINLYNIVKFVEDNLEQ